MDLGALRELTSATNQSTVSGGIWTNESGALCLFRFSSATILTSDSGSSRRVKNISIAMERYLADSGLFLIP